MKDMNMNLDVLGDVFVHKSTSYKYYWVLSLLDYVERGRLRCSINEVVVGMMLRGWDEATMEQRSVGGQDRLYERIRELKRLLKIGNGVDKEEIRMALLAGLCDAEVRKIFVSLEGNVPYRFLSPWIESKSNSEVERLSRGFENGCPYGIWTEMVKINPEWIDYLKEHSGELKKGVEEKLNEYLNK